MSQGLTTSVVMSLFLLVTSVIFLFLTSSWTDQSFNTAQAIADQRARVETAISFKSTAQSDPEECDTYTAQVDNTGKVAVEEFKDMDLLVEYTNTSNSKVATRLTNPSDWSVTGITPDSRDPNNWNPDETATITLTLSPSAKDGTKGTIIAVTPLGISDAIYFTCIVNN